MISTSWPSVRLAIWHPGVGTARLGSPATRPVDSRSRTTRPNGSGSAGWPPPTAPCSLTSCGSAGSSATRRGHRGRTKPAGPRWDRSGTCSTTPNDSPWLSTARWLLYNLLVAERYEAAGHNAADSDPDRCREELAVWSDDARARRALFASWDREAFWDFVRTRNARVDPASQRFFDTWLGVVERDETQQVADDSGLRQLAEERGMVPQAGQARLTPGPSNDKLLAAWRGGTTGRVTYRWPQVRSLVTDVLDGLERTRAGT